jgi:predicted transcriptional regulator
MQPVCMVRFLVSKGYSESKIADVVGTSQPTIHRIKGGSSTTYETGKRIESLFLAEGGDESFAQSAKQ